jgi:hypothetical protein
LGAIPLFVILWRSRPQAVAETIGSKPERYMPRTANVARQRPSRPLWPAGHLPHEGGDRPSPQLSPIAGAEVKGGGWEVQDWSPDDKQLLVGEGISINESYLWRFDVAAGKARRLTPARRPTG